MASRRSAGPQERSASYELGRALDWHGRDELPGAHRYEDQEKHRFGDEPEAARSRLCHSRAALHRDSGLEQARGIGFSSFVLGKQGDIDECLRKAGAESANRDSGLLRRSTRATLIKPRGRDERHAGIAIRVAPPSGHRDLRTRLDGRLGARLRGGFSQSGICARIRWKSCRLRRPSPTSRCRCNRMAIRTNRGGRGSSPPKRPTHGRAVLSSHQDDRLLQRDLPPDARGFQPIDVIGDARAIRIDYRIALGRLDDPMWMRAICSATGWQEPEAIARVSRLSSTRPSRWPPATWRGQHRAASKLLTSIAFQFTPA